MRRFSGLFEPPGKRNFAGRDERAKMAAGIQGRGHRDKTRPKNPANSGLIAENQEISVRRECVVGLRGLELRAKHAVAIEPVSRE